MLNRLHILYIILLMSALCSCAASKDVQKEETVDYSSQLNSMTEQMQSLMSNVNLQRQEITEKLSNIKVENKTTYLSVPDSTGHQYPTMISETKSQQEDKENTSIDTNIQATIEGLSYRIDSLQISMSTLIKSKSKEVRISWWDKYKYDITILSLVVIIAWLITKRRNK